MMWSGEKAKVWPYGLATGSPLASHCSVNSAYPALTTTSKNKKAPIKKPSVSRNGTIEPVKIRMAYRLQVRRPAELCRWREATTQRFDLLFHCGIR
jgi:hypothetical protein